MKSSFALVCVLPLLFAACTTTSMNPRSAARSSRASRAERASTLFQQLDINHDGYLTRAELSSGLRVAGAPDINPNLMLGLKNADKKKSVKASRPITEAEIEKTMKEAFDERDKNLDKRLSEDEFKKLVVERPREENEDPWAPFM